MYPFILNCTALKQVYHLTAIRAAATTYHYCLSFVRRSLIPSSSCSLSQSLSVYLRALTARRGVIRQKRTVQQTTQRGVT